MVVWVERMRHAESVLGIFDVRGKKYVGRGGSDGEVSRSGSDGEVSWPLFRYVQRSTSAHNRTSTP